MRSDTNVIFQDGSMEFVKNNTNKGIAIEWILRKLKITHNELLVAGNAINDVEMLDVDSRATVLVGPADNRDTIKFYLSKLDDIVEVDSPDDLGKYLLS
jgi:hydroxymethylpyrimidine pyrophosphatase-like HAD family hydrolase